MKESALYKKSTEGRSINARNNNPYYSVEISLEGLEAVYQFKVWNTRFKYKCILIREDSRILPRINVGDRLKMKYNLKNAPPISEYLKTAILFVIRKNQGRLRGHCLVGLEIIKPQI
jgi:hypothetical protein